MIVTRWKKLSWTLCLGAVMGVPAAYAARIVETIEAEFPGVDVQGNLDEENTGPGDIKVLINDKNGKFKGKGSATVPNESNSKQKYNEVDLGAMGEFDGIGFTRASYRVSKKGAAKLAFAGVVELL